MTGQRPRESEARVLAALDDPSATEASVRALVDRLAADARFASPDDWKGRARNPAVEDWRRLAAYRVLVERVLKYPLDRTEFVREVLASTGVPEAEVTDMSRVGALPFERQRGDQIFMARLPIRTSVGPASVYFAVNPDDDLVRTAKVYPDSVR